MFTLYTGIERSMPVSAPPRNGRDIAMNIIYYIHDRTCKFSGENPGKVPFDRP